MALEDFYEPFYLQSWISYTDPFGWPDWKWGDGALIKAGLILDTSTEARIAEAQGVKSLYTLMIDPRVKVEFQDVLRRVKTNEYFRITGNPADDTPPEMATVQFLRVSAEKIPADEVTA